MNTPQNDATFTFNSSTSREKIRQQFLAACESSAGGTPPNPEDNLSVFGEPERSQLRTELAEVLNRYSPSSGNGSSVSAAAKGTVSNHTAETKLNQLNAR